MDLVKYFERSNFVLNKISYKFKAEQVFKMDHYRTNTGQVKNPEVFKMQIKSQNKY